MEIREINAEETERLLECMMRLSEHHNQVSINFKGYFPRNPYEETLHAFHESLKSGKSHIAVVRDHEKIAGFCKVDVGDRSGKLDYLIVLPEYRGKGIGKDFMDWAMAVFRRYGIKNIEVKVVDGNDAIRLYEKYGFKMNAHILCYRE